MSPWHNSFPDPKEKVKNTSKDYQIGDRQVGRNTIRGTTTYYLVEWTGRKWKYLWSVQRGNDDWHKYEKSW